MPGTDGELRSLTIARLSDSRYAAAIATARAQHSERLATLTAEIDQIEALAAALSEKVGRREMTLADFDSPTASCAPISNRWWPNGSG